MGLCKTKSHFAMYTVNGLLFIFGIVIAGVAGAAKANRGAIVEKFPEYADIVPDTNATLALAGGILLLLIAIVGIFGACKHGTALGKTALILYIIFVILVLIMEVIAVLVVFLLAGLLGAVADKDPATFDEAQNKAFNFTDTVYNKCCENQKAMPNNEGCAVFDGFLDDAACANTVEFRKAFINWVKGNLMVIGGVTVAIIIIQIATLYSACCLLCCIKKEDDDLA